MRMPRHKSLSGQLVVEFENETGSLLPAQAREGAFSDQPVWTGVPVKRVQRLTLHWAASRDAA